MMPKSERGRKEISKETELLFTKFGNETRVLEIMKSGEVEPLGTIEEFCAKTYKLKVPPHLNAIKTLALHEGLAGSVVVYEVKTEEKPLICVYKPLSGEHEEFKRKNGFEALYPQEIAAYLVDRHFQLGIVPPTIYREIGRDKGSLQLFIDPLEYGQPDEIAPKFESDDYHKLAFFDWMIFNADRSPDNYFVNKNNPQSLVAIDHGASFNVGAYLKLELRGPSLALTYNNEKKKPKKVEIPSQLKTLIDNGLKTKEELNKKLIEIGIAENEIYLFWRRVEQLKEKGFFLSKENFHIVFELSLDADIYNAFEI